MFSKKCNFKSEVIMNKILGIIVFILLLFSQCKEQERILVIAISKAKPTEFYGNYSQWLNKCDSNVKIVNMYELGVDSALKILEWCDGLIISGGADVYPEWYNQLEDTILCGEFDRYRDTLEIALINKAISKKMPILGICRGEQIINVALGGSLVPDIPSQKSNEVLHRQDDWENCFHEVSLVQNSLLVKLCGATAGKVNSNHHQCIDRLSDDLTITAWSTDSIPEAVEWKNTYDKGFLMAVQWHPERLNTVAPAFSTPIINEFVIEAYKYLKNK
jgi:putative glutamine amidotransferase